MLGVKVNTDRRANLGPDVAKGVRREMMNAADKGFQLATDVTPVGFTHELTSSWVAPQWIGDTLVWGNRAGHADDVETGTDPHPAPIEPLRDWARVVLGYEPAAGAVQEKIEEQGTEAQPMAKPGFDAMVEHLRQHGLVDSIRSARGP